MSTNYTLDGLKFWIHVANIHVEGTMSQIFYLGLRFCFMSKNGELFPPFLNNLFLDFIKKTKTGSL